MLLNYKTSTTQSTYNTFFDEIEKSSGRPDEDVRAFLNFVPLIRHRRAAVSHARSYHGVVGELARLSVYLGNQLARRSDHYRLRFLNVGECTTGYASPTHLCENW